jgi:hypothetical protein
MVPGTGLSHEVLCPVTGRTISNCQMLEKLGVGFLAEVSSVVEVSPRVSN